MGRGDVQASAAAKDHIEVHDPTAAVVCVLLPVETERVWLHRVGPIPHLPYGCMSKGEMLYPSPAPLTTAAGRRAGPAPHQL